MNDVTKVIKSLEDSWVLIDGITETAKHEVKKQEGRFIGALLAPLAFSSVLKVLKGIRIRRAGKGYMDKKF